MVISKELVDASGGNLDANVLYMMEHEPDAVYLRLLIYKKLLSEPEIFATLMSKV